jgi:hypothetical protein
VSEYKSAIGPIPDEWFENDAIDDAKMNKMEPDGFTERLLKNLKGGGESSPQAPPAQQQQSSPDSPSSNPEAKYGR